MLSGYPCGVRTFLSAVLTLVAMAAIVLAVPSLWVKERLVDSEGFASSMRPVAEQQKVRDYMTEQITQGVIDRTGGSGSITGGVTSAFVTPLARAYTDSNQFEDDFVQVVADQHDYLFDKPGADAADDQGLQLDIAPMVNRVLNKLGISAQTDEILVELSGSNLEAGRYHKTGRDITRLALASAAAAVIGALGGLLIARRRGVVLLFLGLATVAAAVVSYAVSVVGADRAKDELTGGAGSDREVSEAIVDTVLKDLHEVAFIVGGAGLGVALLGAAIAVAMRRRG